MNEGFRMNHVKSANEMGIDLKDFRLDPESMMKLGNYYTSFRNLSKTEWRDLRNIWVGQLNESNFNTIYDFKNALLYWCNSITKPVQVIDLMTLGQLKGIMGSSEYMNKMELNLSINELLITKYLEMRESVK